MPRQAFARRTSAAPGWLRGAATVLALVALTGCDNIDDLLDVEAPGQVIAEDLDDPRHADLLVHAAVTDFECALAGYIVAAGTFGDELADAQTNYAGYWPVDRRDIGEEGGALVSQTCDTGTGNPNVFPGIYTSLHTARFLGDDVAARLEGWSDAEVADRQSLLATAYAHAGYAVLLLGESYCTIAIDRGPELSRAQAFGEAESRFTKAIAAAEAAGDAPIRDMAYLGRARARLNLGVAAGAVADAAKLAEAAADARRVPAGFVKVATYAGNPPRRNNSVYNATNFLRVFTVEDDFRNVTHQGVADPRVAVVNTGQRGVDGITNVWAQTKYAGLDSPIPIASHDEARLIIAEAELESGNVGEAVTIINELHAAVGLPAYGGGSAAEVRQHLREERAHELFLEGHHLGDRLRYDVPFTPAAGSPWPKGGLYGGTRCLPLPLQEAQDNPNID